MVTTANGHFTGSDGISHAIDHIEIRRITVADLRWALARGIEDFGEKRGDILFIGLLYPLVGLLASLFALNVSLMPVIFPLVAGLSLLGPAVATGFYEIARYREQGEKATWRHFFDVFTSPSIGQIGALTFLLALIFIVWLGVAWTIYLATIGPMDPHSIGQFLRAVLTTPQGWTLIVAGNFAGFVFAALVLTISVVSFPLLVERPVSLATAVKTSIRAVTLNPGPIALWGLIVAALLLLGSIPFFLGLAVILPVLGYATWHLYTRLVEP